MQVETKSLDWYLQKIKNKEPFSLGHYGDGEIQCILNHFGDNFTGNCEGTNYTKELTKAMVDSMYFKPDNFYFAISGMLQTYTPMKHYAKGIDKHFPNKQFYEKGIWNEAMHKGELYPLIKELRNQDVYIVGNKMLRNLTFLNYKGFYEVSYPNCFGELEEITKQILKDNKEGVYIFACGIPATLFVQKLHGKIPNSWFIDMGSIWDGFIGIGGQRPTRREFYLHPETWKDWVKDNLKDIEWETKELPKVLWHGMGSFEINPNL